MSNVVTMKSGRGGARPNAGRKPGSATKENGRFVYVIHEADDPSICKIGIANDPIRRLRAHQVSTWRRLKLAAAFTAPTAEAASSIEASVHKTLWGVHVSGEWFKVSPERAVAEVEAVASCIGIGIKLFEAADMKTIKIIQND